MQPSPPPGAPDEPAEAAGSDAAPRSSRDDRARPAGHRRALSRREATRARKDKHKTRQKRGQSARPGRQRRETRVTAFDEFYLGTRRRVLLQSLALTGDLDVARSAVRDAYAAAYHHWRKVGRSPDPESWVRPQAWGRARRRARAHPLHREKGLDQAQAAVLGGLARLSDPQRKAILLTHLASLPMDEIGRELAMPRSRVEHHLQTGSTQLALDLDCASTAVRPHLESLESLVASPGLPRARAIRRNGVHRRRWHVFGGALAGLALASASGWFVSTQSPGLSADARRALEHPVTAAMLLHPRELAPIATTGWRTTSTGPNTSGDGLHSSCQTSRFADNRGLRAWVRTFDGPDGRELVQAVEVSTTPGASKAAYARTVRWYSACPGTRVHLTKSFRIKGLGDASVAIELSTPAGGRYLVNVARSGELTQTTLLHTGQAADRLARVDDVAGKAMHGVCRAGAVAHCRTGPLTARTALLPTGGPRAMLAPIDLPMLSSLTRAWVGTDVSTTGKANNAATPCDKTTFTGAGRKPRSRSFLIPNASVPAQFGITETYAAFGSTKEATAFADGIRHRMKTCEHRNLGSTVGDAFTGRDLAGWRVTSEINAKRTKVAYWMGVVRVGRLVAQVGFTPTDDVDVTRAEFQALVVRARDRLATRKGATR